MHQGWMFSIQVEIGLSQFFGMKLVLPSRTAAIAGFASSFAFTYHWSVRYGSITTLERSPCGTACVMLLDLVDQPERFQIGDDALARFVTIQPPILRRAILIHLGFGRESD